MGPRLLLYFALPLWFLVKMRAKRKHLMRAGQTLAKNAIFLLRKMAKKYKMRGFAPHAWGAFLLRLSLPKTIRATPSPSKDGDALGGPVRAPTRCVLWSNGIRRLAKTAHSDVRCGLNIIKELL